MMYFIDTETAKGSERALYYLTHAFQSGCPDAGALLNYINKEETDKAAIFKRVFEWHMDNKNTNTPRIMFNIGWMYYVGLGTDQSYTKALYYFEISASRNYSDAQLLLGCLYENGQDWARAIEWYTKAANQGNDTANYYLGNIYHYGRGVEVDYQLAFQYYQTAADQGNADAQLNLGLFYNNGQGTDQDWAKFFFCINMFIIVLNCIEWKGSIRLLLWLLYIYIRGE
jgi:TPR repeat protein